MRLERVADAGLHGAASKSNVAAMALQLGLTVLENLWLGDPVPETLEPIAARLRTGKTKGHMPYGARPVALDPKKTFAQLEATSDAVDYAKFENDERARIQQQLSDAGDRHDWHACEELDAEIDHNAADLSHAWSEEEIAEIESARKVEVPDDPLSRALFGGPIHPMDVQDSPGTMEIVLASDIEFKLLFGHERRTTPDGLCTRCANKPRACVCIQNHRAMQEAAGPDEPDVEYPMHPIEDDASLFQDVETEEVEPIDNDHLKIVAGLEEENEPRDIGDPMKCRHGVRLDAKVPCNRCSPFG